MTKRASPETIQDPEMRRLAIEEREAEVAGKKADAERKQAEAARKRREAGLEDDDPETSGKLEGGITRDRFVTIHRRIPGEQRWPYWKRMIPLDEVDSINDYIQAEGDPRYEHKVVIVNGKNKPIKKPVYFPAQETDPEMSSSSDLDRQIKDADRKLKERRDRKRLERKLRKLEEEDEEEEDEEGGREEDHVFNPMLGGWFPRNHPMSGMGMMPGMMPPWMQQPKEDSSASLLKILVPVLTAWISRPADKSPLESMIPLLINSAHAGQLDPKSMIGMFSPFVLEMGKVSSENNRLLMESMAKMDDTFRKKMLDLIMSDPSRTPDEIEKWSKWLKFGEEALRKAAGVVRDATSKNPTAPRRLEQRKPPALPGPKKEGDSKQPEGDGDKGATAAAAASDPAPEQQDPKAAAALLKKQRVDQFLLGVEEELLAESEPEMIAETFEPIYLALPKSIRAAVESAVEDDPPDMEKLVGLFGMLKEISPEITERIVTSIMESDERQEWMKEFLVACAFPDEEEEGGEGEGEPAPAGPGEVDGAQGS